MGIMRHGQTLYHMCHLDLFDDLFECYGPQTLLHITLHITVGEYEFEQPSVQIDDRAVRFLNCAFENYRCSKNRL